MAQLAIKGHPTRGKEVIQLLETLGGINSNNLKAISKSYFYYIKDAIINIEIAFTEDFKIYTLEEFEEKYPYKVGDKVQRTISCGSVYVIEQMKWEDNQVKYVICDLYWKNCKCTVTSKDLQPYKEETDMKTDCKKCGLHYGSARCFDMDYCQVIGNDTSSNGVDTSASSINEETMEEPEPKAPILSNRYDYAEGKCGYVIPDGYEFDCIKNGFQNEIILKPKKPKHPTTSVESCEVLGYTVDDVIFTNDTGWIRITNKLWDCYAKEHVYEGIGIISGHEYKDIRHHNVTGKMQLGLLKHCKDVDDVRYVNSITDDIMINQITNKVSVIKFKPDVCDNKIELQLGDYEIEVRDGRTFAVKKKPHYPKTYKECEASGFNSNAVIVAQAQGVHMNSFAKLIVLRNAYWKIAGEEMGLDKPWKPDWEDEYETYYTISYDGVNIKCYNDEDLYEKLAFPTAEMRDAFYENFKGLIEQCKELL